MTQVAEVILVRPTRPTVEIGDKLRQFGRYDSLVSVPKPVLRDVTDLLQHNQVLAVWVLRTFVAGWRTVYSIEDRAAALATHTAQSEDYRRHNPALMHIYQREDLAALLQ